MDRFAQVVIGGLDGSSTATDTGPAHPEMPLGNLIADTMRTAAARVG